MSEYLIIFFLFGAIQGFFLSVCLFVKRGKPGKIIALIVFLISFDLLFEYLYWSNGWYDQWKMYITREVSLANYKICAEIKQVFAFISGPLIYLYTCTLSRHAFRKKLFFLHFIPALATAFIFIAVCYKPIYLSCDLFYMYDERMVPRFVSLLYIASNAQIVVYLLASLLVIGKYRERILCCYSNTRDIGLTWLALFIISAFGIMSMAWTGMYLEYHRSHYANMFYSLHLCGMSVSVYCIGFLALVRPNTYSRIHNDEIEKEPEGRGESTGGDSNSSTVHKYKKNHLSDDKKREYLDTIRGCMDEKKPYLDPDLTLGGFSGMTGIPTHSISQVINELLGQNFFHFVNHYRVEYARELLADAERGESIISVCFRAGFNSKSVFNSVFKKHTGLTPSSFRETAFRKTPESDSGDTVERAAGE